MHVRDFEKHSELIAKFLAGESSLSEKEALFAWTSASSENRQFFEETEKVWKMANDPGTSLFEADMDAAWLKIDGHTTKGTEEVSRKEGKVVKLKRRSFNWRAAAAILLLAVAGLWWVSQGEKAPKMVEIKTLPNEKQEINLPDGSHVWLNENSTLAYAEDFAERKINLEGEAYFEVEHIESRPFEITSEDATTTVLGTSFNVRAYPDEDKVEVTVETGKVALAVTNEVAKPVYLPAGTSGVVLKEEHRAEMEETKINNAISWKTQQLAFDETLIKDVITTLERFFGTHIRVSNEMIYECTFNSTFDHPDLNQVLDVISASIGVHIQKNNGDYLLVGEGCHPDN